MFINAASKFSYRIFLIIVCGLITYSCAQAAQQILPSGGLPYGAVNGEIGADHLVIGPIAIGKDTISSLFAKFGRSPIAKGDAGSPALVCYISDKAEEQTTIIFEAWGTDVDSELIGFTLLAEKTDKTTIKSGSVSAKCSPSSLIRNVLRTASGIGVGLDTEALKKILGQPLHQSQDKMYYAYWSKALVPVDERATLPKQSGGAAPWYDILSVIEISMKNGRAVSIEIRKTETY